MTAIPDRPSNLQAFLGVIAREKGNIFSISHDRSQVYTPLDQAEVETVVEIQGREHGAGIIAALREHGFTTIF